MNATEVAILDDENVLEIVRDIYGENDTDKPVALDATVIYFEGKVSILFPSRPAAGYQFNGESNG